jgi:hypothetical protein
MQAVWEKLGVLGPIYRLVGEGFSDREIAGTGYTFVNPWSPTALPGCCTPSKLPIGRSWRKTFSARHTHRVPMQVGERPEAE